MDSEHLLKESKILIVDDHRNIRLSLKLTLEEEGAVIEEADSFKEGLLKLGGKNLDHANDYDAMLFDIRLGDGNGLDLLKLMVEKGLANRVIMISGEGTMSEAFKSTQMGAFDFIEKPFTTERIMVSVSRCLGFNNIKSHNERLHKSMLKGSELLGSHPSITELKSAISRIAPTNGRVLIQGESGSGKELVAKSLHRESKRAGRELIKVNCAAIPHSLVESELFGHVKGSFTGALKDRKGLFEQAHQGTLFLDEIGELSLEVQAKLLRVLQNGELIRVGSEKPIKVDVRLLCATHRDLSMMVEKGEFREDLFYRLNVITLSVPPLRDRVSDIAQLAGFFLEEACKEHAVGERFFSKKALSQIEGYGWPGNIRELKNIVERSAILSETQVIDEVSGISSSSSSLESKKVPAIENKEDSSLERFSIETGVLPWQEFHAATGREYLKFVLQKAEGNVSEAARILCLERAYLHRLLKKMKIQRGVVFSG